MYGYQNTRLVVALKQMPGPASRGAVLTVLLILGAIALAAGFTISWVAQAEAATDATVALSPQGVAFPPQEYSALLYWDHMVFKPPDTTKKYYYNVHGRDACELLAAIYGGRPSDYWAPGLRQFDGTKWISAALTPSDLDWIPYPASYGTQGDDATDHHYLTGHSMINLAKGEYQLGQGVLGLGKYSFPDASYVARNSITIRGAGKGKTFLNGDYARDSLYAVWSDDSGGVTVVIRDLAINSSVGSLGSAGFTLSNVKVDIPLIARSDPQFGFKNSAISVYVDYLQSPDRSIGNITIENCEFISDGTAIYISAADYVHPLSQKHLTISGNRSSTGYEGFLITGDVPNRVDWYAYKVVTDNYIELGRRYSDPAWGGMEGLLCDSGGGALIAHNEIAFRNNAPLVHGIEIGTYFPAAGVVVQGNRIYQTFSGLIGEEVGGFGISLGGYWGTYTPSHENIFIGNNLVHFSPSLGTYYLGQDAYDNVIVGNAGTVGYDGEPSPIPNNFITGVAPFAGATGSGP